MNGRGVSPLFATVILLAIVAAAGVWLFMVFFGSSQSIATSTKIQVEPKLVKATGSSKAVLTLTVKNIGSTAIESVEVKVDGVDLEKMDPSFSVEPNLSESPLPPGGACSVYASFEKINNETIIPGRSFSIVVTARDIGGNIVTESTSVVCTTV